MKLEIKQMLTTSFLL